MLALNTFFFSFVFFFQAEDGIRDLYVTGVQTCALPISAYLFVKRVSGTGTFTLTGSVDSSKCNNGVLDTGEDCDPAISGTTCCNSSCAARSEERRVGKEGRSRGSRDD